MNYVVIIPSSKTVGRGWDMSNCRIIRFRNFKKLFYFAMYYSLKHDVLIRVYIRNNWQHTYCDGNEIWNCF